MITTELVFHRVWDQAVSHSEGWVTQSGKSLEIIYPGTYSHGEGPDFRFARIWMNHRMILTDIEIELRAENWYHHRHHLNPEYQNVRLVVVMEDPVGKIQLEHSLSNDPIDILWWPAPQSLPPEEAFLSGLNCPLHQADRPLNETLTQLGWKRLESKFSRFRIRYQTNEVFDELFYQGIMEGLGYTRNRDAFLRLSSYLNLSIIRQLLASSPEDIRPFVLQAVFFKVSGWEEQVNRQAPAYMNHVRSCLAQSGLKLQFPVFDLHWKLSRLRPYSHPISRLVYLSFWLSWAMQKGLTEFFLAWYYQEGASLKLRLRQALIPPISPSQRLELDQCYFALPHDLIGRPRIDILIFNVLLPLLWIFFGQEKIDPHQKLVLKEIMGYPLLSDNFPQSLVRERWNLVNRPKIKLKHAIQQQGLIYIYQQFCLKGHCEKCRIR